MRTSIVVVSYRPHQWLAACLHSVADQADQVVLVDNGSPDATIGDAGRAVGAQVVRLPKNRGFPGGVDAGLRHVTGDVIALLNDDAMAEPGWLSTAAEVLRDDTIGVVAPKLLFATQFAEILLDDPVTRVAGEPRPLGRMVRHVSVDGVDVVSRLIGPGIHKVDEVVVDGRVDRWRWTAGPVPFFVPLPHTADADAVEVVVDGAPQPVRRVVSLVNNAGSFLSEHGHAGDYGYEAVDGPVFDVAADRFGVCGGAMVTTARVLGRVGDLAGSFFAYYEDTDWSWRVQLSGLRARYDPGAVVRHVGGVSSGGPGNARFRLLAGRNRHRCLLRNAPLGVAGRELVETLRRPALPGLRRAVLATAARDALDRVLLARQWTRQPADVWRQWAGVDNTWPAM